MKKVYIVRRIINNSIHGVFSTKRKAEDCFEVDNLSYDEYEITCLPIDPE